MPLDSTGYALPMRRVPTEDETRDLAVLKLARHFIRYQWMWLQIGGRLSDLFQAFFGGSCAETAILRAALYRSGVTRSAVAQLGRQLPPGWHRVADYNDASTTTHADILALFDRAIAELE
jgi:hypothetical protein